MDSDLAQATTVAQVGLVPADFKPLWPAVLIAGTIGVLPPTCCAMSKAKIAAVILGGSADETEAAFYDALQSADIERLMACWADDEDIVCVHPGGPRIVGPAAIRATFDAIFANGSIRAWPEQVRKIDGLGSEVHNVMERVEVLTPSGLANAYVLATNVFHKTALGWRMVAHHASPGSQTEVQEIHEQPQVLH